MTAHETHTIDADAIRAELEQMSKPGKIEHAVVLQQIIDRLENIDFRDFADLGEGERIGLKHYRVITVQEVLRTAGELNCGLCRNFDFVYAYNGEFWKVIERDDLEAFLGEAAEKLGVSRITARDFEFKAKLVKQFLADARLEKPVCRTSGILINLKNGTVEIDGGSARLRGFDRADFLRYQLPFVCDKQARYPKWQAFLAEVLPDRTKQLVLAEYFGYIFARDLKLEKTLLLFGTGANGKSVVFEVMNAVLGSDNVTNYSLESLCHEYFRPKIANVLLNYSSDISSRLQAEKFKLLTSGEPIEARLPYGQPFMMTNYARLAFNCNELPKDVEHSEAYFRRFLILHFDQYIPEDRRNPNLAKEIIENELSGVFTWVLSGLQRLVEQKNFTPCESAQKMIEIYKRESNSVAMFLVDERYRASVDHSVKVKEIFGEYKAYCAENNYRALGRNNFAKRLESSGIPRIDTFQPMFLIERF
jgi:putative DNA primase/helicase